MHDYILQNGNLYYATINESGNTEKKLKLSDRVKECSFLSENNKLKISIKIGDIVYNNSFTI